MHNINFSYDKRSSESIHELGKTLTIMFRRIPFGILVVFPCYKLLNDCKNE